MHLHPQPPEDDVKLQTIRGIYEADGPMATVYLEARSPGDDAEQQVRLRWDALRRHLDGAGADPHLLSALDEAILGEEFGEVQADGRVLVANAEGILLDEARDAAVGAGDDAHLTREPELGAYVRERARSVRLLVVVADQEGALIRREVAIEDRPPGIVPGEDVGPDAVESVHAPRGQAFSHNQIRRRADDAARQNAQGVASRVESVAKQWRPDVLVLAGEVQGRTAVRAELAQALTEILQEVEVGGVDDEGAEEALAEGLREVASRVAAERARDNAERFEEARAHGRAVEGAGPVGRAAEQGAVDTILLEIDRTVPEEGALIAAGTRTDAAVGLLEAPVTDGVAAVLRYEVPDELVS